MAPFCDLEDMVKENRQAYWNRVYAEHGKPRVDRSNWLEGHREILVPPSHILDMGCGAGATTEYLISHGHSVIAVDISDVALERLNSRVPEAETQVLDFALGLPWEKATFDVVVADLCLHYFDFGTTKGVIIEILRVLKTGGFLLARVNSVRDTAHGYGKGDLVEPGFFVSDGHHKRFFDRASIQEVFEPFELEKINEECIGTRDGEKHLYEIAARKR